MVMLGLDGGNVQSSLTGRMKLKRIVTIVVVMALCLALVLVFAVGPLRNHSKNTPFILITKYSVATTAAAICKQTRLLS